LNLSERATKKKENYNQNSSNSKESHIQIPSKRIRIRISMTTTTVLSACGGFTTRRNIHIQARNELKLAANSSPSISCGQLQESTTTATSATNTKAAAATTLNLCSRLNAPQIYSSMCKLLYHQQKSCIHLE